MKFISAIISITLAAKVSAACWSTRLGYPCCTYTTQVIYTDLDGQWGIENEDWCGIDTNTAVNSNCWAIELGYRCCSSTLEVVYVDENGQWGVENNEWCGIIATNTPKPSPTPSPTPPPQRPNKLSRVDQTFSVKMSNAFTINGGKFEGFGTSFCWWANRLGYSDVLAEKAATAFYDKDNGLGLTIIRYNIGGGDNPSHNHITRTDSNMPGYAINPSYDNFSRSFRWDYNWNNDFNQRNVLMKAVAKNREEIIVEAFSNSPPYFMTNSGCSTGAFNGNDDNLRGDAYGAFAKYLADITEHYKNSWGITFQSITAMNEPYTDYWTANSNKQEGCHFEQGNSQSRIIVELSNALKQKGLGSVQISGTDETSPDVQIESYKKLSNEAKNIITRIDVHTYWGSKLTELRNLAESSRKNLWMSEVDGDGKDGTNSGEMGAGLWLANRIISDLNGLRSSAWIIWQIIDSHISRNGYNGRKDSGMVNVNNGFWGTAVADHDNNNIILTQKYYAFGQLSRYIRPGYTVIAGTNSSIYAYDKVGKKLVVVATNKEASNRTIDVDLSDFSKVGYKVRVIRTSGSVNNGEKWAELTPIVPYGKGFNAELKAYSVTTFIVFDVEK